MISLFPFSYVVECRHSHHFASDKTIPITSAHPAPSKTMLGFYDIWGGGQDSFYQKKFKKTLLELSWEDQGYTSWELGLLTSYCSCIILMSCWADRRRRQQLPRERTDLQVAGPFDEGREEKSTWFQCNFCSQRRPLHWTSNRNGPQMPSLSVPVSCTAIHNCFIAVYIYLESLLETSALFLKKIYNWIWVYLTPITDEWNAFSKCRRI